jgi:hypothetical protein
MVTTNPRSRATTRSTVWSKERAGEGFGVSDATPAVADTSSKKTIVLKLRITLLTK